MNTPKIEEIPGTVFTGEYAAFHGQRLPVYAPAPRTDGKPSINTLEGWELHRREVAENHLWRVLHRQPTEAEIHEEMDRNAALAAELMEKIDGGKEPPPLPIVYEVNGCSVEVVKGKGRGLCMPYDTFPAEKEICLVLGRDMTEEQGLQFAKRCIETGKFGFFSQE